MANQTLVQVPTQLNDFDSIRLVLIRLIEKLDIVFGYRGNSKYISENTTVETLAALSETAQNLDKKLTKLLTPIDIQKLDEPSLTISASYTQSEIEAVRDEVVNAIKKINSMIDILKSKQVFQ